MDAGTYRYTAPEPWDNALTQTAVHNTVTVDGLDQMRRAGRFLYLDWAQAKVMADEIAADGSSRTLAAEHDGYRWLGVSHRRTVTAFSGDRWLVEDELTLGGRKQDVAHTFRLHWLLPDWGWHLEGDEAGVNIGLVSPEGTIQLAIHSKPILTRFDVVRGGEVVWALTGGIDGTRDVEPPPSLAIMGWYSPTYALKKPALSLVAEVVGEPGASFVSEWKFPQVTSER